MPDMAMSISSPRFIALCIALFLSSALVTITLRSSQTQYNPNHWPARIGKSTFSSPYSSSSTPHLDHARFAFATFLAGNPHLEGTLPSEDEDDSLDGYYLSARILIYQLLHSPTASPNKTTIPFLVLVTPDVSERKRARLTLDGATIIPVDPISATWIHPGADRWRDVLSKLHLWNLDTWDKICFIDADTLVTAPLDGVFYDEGARVQHTLSNPSQLRSDEADLPPTYLFGTHADFWSYDHDFPPRTTTTSPTEPSYLNCGFFVLAPDKNLFAYYTSLLALENRFDSSFPEQNLLNYAHRREGNMPWKPIWYGWNVNWPTRRDWEGGARSFHAKFWDGDPGVDGTLRAIWREQRAEMEGFYSGVGIGAGLEGG